jgi:hypothetical protein
MVLRAVCLCLPVLPANDTCDRFFACRDHRYIPKDCSRGILFPLCFRVLKDQQYLDCLYPKDNLRLFALSKVVSLIFSSYSLQLVPRLPCLLWDSYTLLFDVDRLFDGRMRLLFTPPIPDAVEELMPVPSGFRDFPPSFVDRNYS